MTNRIDRLTAKGLVVRGPDPNDRRGVLVRLTDSGRELADAALTSLLKNERELLSALPDARLEVLADLLRELTVQFEAD
jgi:DNA-binding MarR family transcriptional regulator